MRLLRGPILGLSLAALLAGLWGALSFLGLPAEPPARFAADHGPLMALGFLGTVISLERAVALGRSWSYGAPLAAALGAAAIVAGLPAGLGPLFLTAGAVILVATYVELFRIEPRVHVGVQALGAAAWLVAGLLWLAGQTVPSLVPWFAAFLVLTIVGERLELSRLRRLSPRAGRAFVVLIVATMSGTLVSILAPDLGTRLSGLAYCGLAAWLLTNDLARRTVRLPGVTRFIAWSLLSGFAWLAVAGLLWLAGGAADGPLYDARLHAVFLGFVISMVFGHAPVIVPAVLGLDLPYRPRFHAHLALLHVGLVVRLVGGDLLGNPSALQAGGVLNELALLLFLASSASAVLQARRVWRPASWTSEDGAARIGRTETMT